VAAPTNTLPGTTGPDILATVTASVVQALDGNDTITLNNATDWLNAGSGADSIQFASTVSTVNGEVKGQDGNDTINVLAAMTAPTFSSTVKGGKNDDLFLVDGVSNYATTKFAGQSGNDTIVFRDLTGTNIALAIKGGTEDDSIRIESGSSFVTTTITGSKGKDTIEFHANDSGASRVSGGSGKDVLLIGSTAAAAAATLSSVVGGKGKDQISIRTGSTVSSIIGGGQQDTITLTTAFAGGAIYGDGGGSTTDGADLIGNSGINVLSAVSVYGGGGNDTIRLETADNGLVIDGGDGADSISVVAGESANSIVGGAGADTISWANTGITHTANSVIDAGADNDQIFIGTTALLAEGESNTTISGGAGDDTISIGALSATNSATLISGGDGADVITLGITATLNSGGVLTAQAAIDGGAGNDTINLIYNHGAMDSGTSAGIVSIAYGAGDVINIGATAGIAAGNASRGLVTVMSGTTAASQWTAASAMGAGDIAVYSDGTNTFFAYSGSASAAANVSGMTFRVTGADLVTYTGAAGDVAVNSLTMGFTISGSATTGVSITLT
jgi:Ca2+-binding RTX toxin-like protein